MMTATDPTSITPFGHTEAMQLQADELEITLRLLRTLTPEEWASQTDCPDWDVRAMYLHVLGACEAGASMRENVHQLVRARKHRKEHGGPLEAGLSHVQVAERAELSAAALVERLATVAPRCVKGRRRTPGLMRNHATMAIDGPVHETWKLGYLVDTIYLRDLWMHRVDTCHALGRPMELTAAHDGRIVAEVVAEWARRHGRPFVLELTGPAGGSFARDPEHPDTERISLDAVEFCRTIGGRVDATGLLGTVVPF